MAHSAQARGFLPRMGARENADTCVRLRMLNSAVDGSERLRSETAQPTTAHEPEPPGRKPVSKSQAVLWPLRPRIWDDVQA